MSSLPSCTFPLPIVAPPRLQLMSGPPFGAVILDVPGLGGGFGTKPFQSSRSLSQMSIVPSAWEVRKRLDRFSMAVEGEEAREGEDGGTSEVGAGGSQIIEVTGELTITPALLKRE